MGKPTGFMETARKESPVRPPLERIKDFNEFHTLTSDKERQAQGARCMNCGVPFCQSGMMLAGMATGCPLHNLIPEWNDEIYHGNWSHALSRLTKTNNFPEFTGRVCPALCEAACTCGLYDSPVTVHDNELSIIEKAFESGEMVARPPKMRSEKSVAVIGSGPSGLACADQLNHRGHNVTVFERDDRIGGLLMYGIPNMKLEKRIVDRRVALMKEEGVIFKTGVDVGKDISPEDLKKQFDAVVLCCGAGNPRDLNLPGRDAAGIWFAVDFLRQTTQTLLNTGSAPMEGDASAHGKHVIVVGGGDTGNDCVGTCIREGCASVTQIEMMPRLPDARSDSNPWPQWPRVCKTDYGQEEAIAVFGHDPRIFESTVKEFLKTPEGNLCGVKIVSLHSEKDEATGRSRMVETPGTERELPADMVLIAAGFLGPRPYIAEAFGLNTTQRTTVATEDRKYRTSVPGVFCAGDMHRGQSLVVWAITEGRAAAKEVDLYLMGYSNML